MPPLTQGIDRAAIAGRVIDPANLTQAQRSGMRCVFANCKSTKISLGRFQPTNTGYRLIEEVSS